MGGAGQWTPDHRRSLTPQEAGRQRRENRRKKREQKEKGISRPGQRDTSEMTATQTGSRQIA